MTREPSETVQRRAFADGGKDAHGNETEGWADPVDVDVYAFDPGSTSEPRDGSDRVVVEPTLYMPSDVSFGHRDRVEARGETYEVDGETRVWVHPRRGPIGNVVTLRRVDG